MISLTISKIQQRSYKDPTPSPPKGGAVKVNVKVRKLCLATTTTWNPLRNW